MLRALIGLAALAASHLPLAALGADFQVIAYHDVRDDVREYVDIDQYAISTRRLIDQFTWLRVNGFTPVSVDDLLAARRGDRALPDKAVLLTFGDGFRSVYTHVYPLLRLFNYPAVVSVVTSWITGESFPSDGAYSADQKFVSWEELREMQQSGLVEIASHSHDLHRGVPGNPQGNTQQAAVTRIHRDGHYETDAEYFARIRGDLERSIELIRSNVGVAPRIMTWPYGAYNRPLLDLAAELGMPTTMTLDSVPKSLDRLDSMSRHLVQANPEVIMLGFDLLYEEKPGPIRAAHVDLDYVYDPDPEQQERNLGQLLDRVKSLAISHVFLQAFADPDGDGGAQAVYFPNRHLPMRADLFNRAMWQLRTRTGVQVYAWMPILSFEGPDIDPRWRVMQERDGQIFADQQSEPRLSPFSSDARRLIAEVYEDLAKAAPIAGILFHDDGRLNEFEDASVYAAEAWHQAFGDELSIPSLAADPDRQQRWARLKTQTLIDLTDQLMDAVREWQPNVKSARNIFSSSLLHDDAERWLAQDYPLFLETYDHVALMAMPYFEGAPDHELYFEELLAAVDAQPLGRARTIFELQTVDWRHNKVIPSEEISRTMRWLQSRGVRHLAYYPDDFILGHPKLRPLRRGMSLAQYPIEVPQ